EVEGVALVGVDLDTRSGLARLRRLGVETRAVPRERRRVEVDAVGGDVRVALRDEALDEGDHLGYVIGRLADDLRIEDVQLRAIDEELLRVALGDGQRIDVLAFRGERDLVLGVGVGIADEVARVGDVHHLLHRVAGVLERTACDVGGEVAVEVTDVLPVVDGRTAVVDAYLARAQRLERAHRARDAVVHPDRGGGDRCDGSLPLPNLRQEVHVSSRQSRLAIRGSRWPAPRWL